ncbi:hypothetical protein HJC23_004529, partial [Cyclotella cryptica]
TTGPSPAVTVTSPTFGKLQLTDSPVPERVNPYPGPAISDGPDIVCLSSKNDTSETLHFDDDSVSASICNDDADPYRTCIWRTTTSERCDRMVKNKPFVDSGETLIEGTIHLTLSQNPVATSCKNIIQLEKALLTFLSDNIGSSDTFEPACVFTVDSARDKLLSDDQSIESTALKYTLMFIKKNNVRRALRTKSLQSDSRRTLGVCSNTDEVMCCSQFAINGKLGSYCTSLGCNVNKCGSGRRPRKINRKMQSRQDMRLVESIERRAGNRMTFDNRTSLTQIWTNLNIGEKPIVNSCSFYGELTGEDFNDVVRTYSEFKPEMSRSILGVDDTLSVAVCSSNRFSIEMLGTPVLTCDEYVNASCLENEDLVSEGSTPIKKSSTPLNSNDLNKENLKNDDLFEFSASKVHTDAVGEEEEYQNS